jgi:hypothetical protein
MSNSKETLPNPFKSDTLQTPADKTQWEIELHYPDLDHGLAHGEATLSNRKRTVRKSYLNRVLISSAIFSLNLNIKLYS